MDCEGEKIPVDIDAPPKFKASDNFIKVQKEFIRKAFNE